MSGSGKSATNWRLNCLPSIRSSPTKLAELLPRIAANDREVEYINGHALPSGAGRLLVAELIARNLEGFGKSFGNSFIRIPRITEELCLPTFEYSAHHPYAWPGLR